MTQQLTEQLTTTVARGEAQARTLSMLRRRLHWRRWHVAAAPSEPEVLTSAELSECTCPDLCHRDHQND